MDLFGITEALSKCIIRPPRSKYSTLDLGPTKFDIDGRIYYRTDFSLRNHNNYQIECSLFRDYYSEKIRPLLIFLHANSSCRLSVRNYLKTLLPTFDILGFDFTGSGLSAGDYATLGYHEKEDLKIVVQHMIDKLGVKQIFLWGRSMGAVTTILFMAKYEKEMNGIVKAIALDSPFSDLERLVTELANSYVPILPNFIVGSVIQKLQEHVTGILDKTPLNSAGKSSNSTSDTDSQYYIANQLKKTFSQTRPNNYLSSSANTGNAWNRLQNCQNRSEERSKNQSRSQLKRPLQKFSIYKLSPISCIESIRVPIFFVAGKNDKLVSHEHTLALYEKAKTVKQIEIIDAGHNDPRPDHLKKTILDFLKARIGKTQNQNPQRKHKDWFKSGSNHRANRDQEPIKTDKFKQLLKRSYVEETQGKNQENLKVRETVGGEISLKKCSSEFHYKGRQNNFPAQDMLQEFDKDMVSPKIQINRPNPTKGGEHRPLDIREIREARSPDWFPLEIEKQRHFSNKKIILMKTERLNIESDKSLLKAEAYEKNSESYQQNSRPFSVHPDRQKLLNTIIEETMRGYEPEQSKRRRIFPDSKPSDKLVTSIIFDRKTPTQANPRYCQPGRYNATINNERKMGNKNYMSEILISNKSFKLSDIEESESMLWERDKQRRKIFATQEGRVRFHANLE